MQIRGLWCVFQSGYSMTIEEIFSSVRLVEERIEYRKMAKLRRGRLETRLSRPLQFIFVCKGNVPRCGWKGLVLLMGGNTRMRTRNRNSIGGHSRRDLLAITTTQIQFFIGRRPGTVLSRLCKFLWSMRFSRFSLLL